MCSLLNNIFLSQFWIGLRYTLEQNAPMERFGLKEKNMDAKSVLQMGVEGVI